MFILLPLLANCNNISPRLKIEASIQSAQEHKIQNKNDHLFPLNPFSNHWQEVILLTSTKNCLSAVCSVQLCMLCTLVIGRRISVKVVKGFHPIFECKLFWRVATNVQMRFLNVPNGCCSCYSHLWSSSVDLCQPVALQAACLCMTN